MAWPNSGQTATASAPGLGRMGRAPGVGTDGWLGGPRTGPALPGLGAAVPAMAALKKPKKLNPQVARELLLRGMKG